MRCLVLVLLCAPVFAAESLSETLTRLDAEVFDAYNRCDVARFAALFEDDVEFYHDQSGLSTGKAPLLEALKKNICGKVRRELVPGSLEVHELKGFGAVQMGVHRFLHPGREVEDGVGEARFIHVWRLRDGVWRISRVISYDHHGVGK